MTRRVLAPVGPAPGPWLSCADWEVCGSCARLLGMSGAGGLCTPAGGKPAHGLGGRRHVRTHWGREEACARTLGQGRGRAACASPAPPHRSLLSLFQVHPEGKFVVDVDKNIDINDVSTRPLGEPSPRSSAPSAGGRGRRLGSSCLPLYLSSPACWGQQRLMLPSDQLLLSRPGGFCGPRPCPSSCPKSQLLLGRCPSWGAASAAAPASWC